MIPGWTTATRFVAVDLEDPVHPGERDRQRALDPGGAARQAGARAARHDGDAELGGDADELLDLGRGRGEGDGSRQTTLQIGRSRRSGTSLGRSSR